MKPRIPISAILLVTIFLASSCASLKPWDKEALLKSELEKWENFSSEGVLEANHEGLTLRKMFVLSKTRDEARLDILDGGVFGMNPNPLISVYLGDYTAIRSPSMSQLEAFTALIPSPRSFLNLLGNADSLFAAHGSEILETGRLRLGDTELVFSEEMRLTGIAGKEPGISMDISHTRTGDPENVRILFNEDTSLELLMDATTYGNAELVALPQNEGMPEMEELLKTMEGLFPALRGGTR